MEGVVVSDWAQSFKGLRVLLTGHSGFKGSWMSQWLIELGADVVGFSLEPNTKPSHFEILKPKMESVWGDIRDTELLKKTVARVRPELVIHMAAQPIVRASYVDPVGTYMTNVMGTLYLFEACRAVDSVRAIVNVTSDKCYENVEQDRGYRESDPLGGSDMYSSSKGAAEILTRSYRKSFWPVADFGTKHKTLLASVRAGNVIGGGDWAPYRLVPDAIRAIESKTQLVIRNPFATRPWQHVLEPLRGYLMIASRLLEGEKTFAEGWNFGPIDKNAVPVETLVKGLKRRLPSLDWRVEPSDVKEAKLLKLDSSRAVTKLGWKPVLDLDQTLAMTAAWYAAFSEKEVLTSRQIAEYTARTNA